MRREQVRGTRESEKDKKTQRRTVERAVCLGTASTQTCHPPLRRPRTPSPLASRARQSPSLSREPSCSSPPPPNPNNLCPSLSFPASSNPRAPLAFECLPSPPQTHCSPWTRKCPVTRAAASVQPLYYIRIVPRRRGGRRSLRRATLPRVVGFASPLSPRPLGSLLLWPAC